MIKADLYPDGTSYTFTYNDKTYTMKTSALIKDQSWTDDYGTQYALGWAKSSALPECYKPAHCFYNNSASDEDVLFAIEQLKPNSYYDIGYAFGNNTVFENTPGMDTVGMTTSTTRSAGQTAYARMWNNYYPEMIGVSSYTLGISVVYYDPVGAYADFSVTTITMTPIALKQFLYNDSEYTYTKNATVGAFTYKLADFNEYGRATYTTSSGYQAIVGIIRFNWTAGFYNTNASSTTNLSYSPVSLYLHGTGNFEFNDTESSEFECMHVLAGVSQQSPVVTFRNTGGVYTVQNVQVPIHVYCAKPLRLKYNQLPIMLSSSSYFYWDDCWFCNKSGYQVTFQPLIRPNDLYRIVDLEARFSKVTNLQSYADENPATIVLPSDEFTGQSDVGDVNDPAFKSKLRDWQFIDISKDPSETGTAETSDYDPSEDKPTYNPDDDDKPATDEDPDGVSQNPDDLGMPEAGFEPGASEPPAGFKTGHLNCMNQFIAMSSAAFNLLKYKLSDAYSDQSQTGFWASLSEKKYDGNGQLSEYSVSPTAFIGNYVQSCRAYPFNIPDQFQIDSTSTDIVFGYGGASLSLVSHTLHKLSKPYALINLGEINKIPYLDGKGYGFWDLSPYTTCKIVLPALGSFDLNPQHVIGCHISVRYGIDATNGICTAYVESVYAGKSRMILCKSGKLAYDINITGNNIVQQGDNMATATLTKETAKLNLAHSIYNTARDVVKGMSHAGMNYAKSKGDTKEKAIGFAADMSSTIDSGIQGAFSIAGADISEQNANISMTIASRDVPQTITHGSGDAAFAGQTRAFLIVNRPLIDSGIYNSKETYGHIYGYACNHKGKLMTGYNVVANPSLNIEGATDSENAAINAQLRNGVYIR